MAVGGAGRTTGLAALLLALGVVLAAGALPALAGQTPLDRVSESASDGVDDAVASAAGEAGQPAPGELNDDVAAAAEDAEMTGAAKSLAGLLATFLGEDAVGGALGGSVSGVDPGDAEISPESIDGTAPDGEPTAGDFPDGPTADGTTAGATTAGATTDGPTTDGTTTDGMTTDGTAADSTTDGTSSAGTTDGSTATGEQADGTTDGASGSDGDAGTTGGETTSSDGTTMTGEPGGDAETGQLTQDGDGTTTEQASETDDPAAGDDSPPEPEGLADRGRLETVVLAVVAVVLLIIAVLAYRSDKPAIEFLLSLPTMFANGVTRFVFGVADAVERAIAALRSVSTLAELRALLLATAADAKGSLGSSVRSLLGREPAGPEPAASPSLGSDRQRIRDAWRTVVDVASVSRYPNRTPGEIKQRAVDAGLPEPPVTTLLGAFRAVEYGDRDPGDRADAAVDAAEQVEAAAAALADDDADAPPTEEDET